MRTASIGVSFVNGLRSARRQAHDTAGGTLADCGWLPCAGLKSDWRRLPFGGAFRVLGGIPVLVPIVLPQGVRTPALFIFAYAEARHLPETLPPPRGAIRFFSGGLGGLAQIRWYCWSCASCGDAHHLQTSQGLHEAPRDKNCNSGTTKINLVGVRFQGRLFDTTLGSDTLGGRLNPSLGAASSA